ncbi:MAG: hypothetical protein EB084_21240 [Proteobacteria bacterium]|nr:hypothetical protein [Pseudomonadota bacterium]
MRHLVLSLVVVTSLIACGCERRETSAPPLASPSLSAAPTSVPVVSAPPSSGASLPSPLASNAPTDASASSAPRPAEASGSPMGDVPASPVASPASLEASGAPADVAEATQRLQAATGLVFKVPEGMQSQVKPDGELQLTFSDGLFIAVMAEKSAEEAVAASLAHLGKIDKGLARPVVQNLESGGVRARVAQGVLKVGTLDQQYMVLAFDGGRQALRVVCVGTDLKHSEQARALVDSVKRP